MNKVSIVIVSFNTKELTEKCILSVIKNTKNINYDIWVIDNNSTDGTVDCIKKLSKANKISINLKVNNKNLGFGAANNQGIKLSKSEYILLLNSDTVIEDNVIGGISSYFDKHAKVGVATCKLLNADRTVQGTGGYFPTLLRVFSWMTIQDIPFVDNIIKPFHPHKSKSILKGNSFYESDKELDWVTGAFFFMRREVIGNSGLFDEDYFLYTEETDYCFRIRQKNWKIMYLHNWSIIHLGGASSKEWAFVKREFEGVKMFYKKNYPKWQLPILIVLLKLGASLRYLTYLILGRKEAAKAYAIAFSEA